MSIIYFLTVLVLVTSTLNAYDSYSSCKGCMGNIHHLVQLIGLANKEESALTPVLNSIKCNLKSEKRIMQLILSTFRNKNSQKIRLRKLKNLQDIINNVNDFKSKLETHMNQEKENKVASNEIFMSINSLLHIHHLNGVRVTTGFEYNTEAGGYIKIIHCLEIGILALSKQMYYRAIEWTKGTQEQFPRTESPYLTFVDLQSAIYYLAVQEHNRVFFKVSTNECNSDDLYFINSNIYVQPIEYNPKQMNSHENKELALKITNPEKNWDKIDNDNPHSRFTELCKGKVLQSPGTIKNLYCYYNQHQHPYFYINPVKVEQLSENPPIIQFYELHGNKTMDYMQAFKDVLIDPNTLYGGKSQYKSFNANGFTFARQHMQDLVYPNFPHFGKIMEYLTGLTIRHTAGPMLWGEYIYGRMVDVHTDTKANNMHTFDQMLNFLAKGEVLAGLMHYIESPENGGHTPFIEAGVRVPAIKGSAVFWINLYKNGTIRKDVYHAGCPVLHGNKIIMITPIMYKGNWKNYKCSLDPED